MEYLSANFTRQQLENSAVAQQHNINNAADSTVTANAIELAVNILEPLAQKYGYDNIIVNSWFRCEALERIICQQPYAAWCAKRMLNINAASWATYFKSKQHPSGSAADIEVKGVSKY